VTDAVRSSAASTAEEYTPPTTSGEYEKRRAAGMCGRCGKRPPVGDSTNCADCNAYNAALQAANRATLPYALKELVRVKTKIAVALGVLVLAERCEWPGCLEMEGLQTHHRDYGDNGHMTVQRYCQTHHRMADVRDGTAGSMKEKRRK
jgi:hypothetical protein